MTSRLGDCTGTQEFFTGGVSSGHQGIKPDGFEGLASEFALFVGTGHFKQSMAPTAPILSRTEPNPCAGSGFLPIFVVLTPICAEIPRFAIQIYISQLIPYDEPAKLCSDNLSPKRQIFEIPSFFSSPERGEG